MILDILEGGVSIRHRSRAAPARAARDHGPGGSHAGRLHHHQSGGSPVGHLFVRRRARRAGRPRGGERRRSSGQYVEHLDETRMSRIGFGAAAAARTVTPPIANRNAGSVIVPRTRPVVDHVAAGRRHLIRLLHRQDAARIGACSSFGRTNSAPPPPPRVGASAAAAPAGIAAARPGAIRRPRRQRADTFDQLVALDVRIEHVVAPTFMATSRRVLDGIDADDDRSAAM